MSTRSECQTPHESRRCSSATFQNITGEASFLLVTIEGDGPETRPANTRGNRQVIPAATILFVCLHGSAKSLIAAEHLNVLARERGLALRGESRGVEPDVIVPAAVVAGLADDGIDVRTYVPEAVTAERLALATQIVSFGCDLGDILPRGSGVEQWNDLPLVSDGYATARDAIVDRVATLLDRVGNK
jgi:arsenate reductase (thioredoxin)